MTEGGNVGSNLYDDIYEWSIITIFLLIFVVELIMASVFELIFSLESSLSIEFPFCTFSPSSNAFFSEKNCPIVEVVLKLLIRFREASSFDQKKMTKSDL